MLKNGTPRRYKRMVNQLRLLNMLAAKDENEEQKDERTVKFIPLLVANDLGISLDAMYGKCPQGTSLDVLTARLAPEIKTLLSQRNQEKPIEWLNSNTLDEVSETLAKVLAMFKNDDDFKTLWPSPEDARKFKELMAGIVLARSDVERQDPDAQKGASV